MEQIPAGWYADPAPAPPGAPPQQRWWDGRQWTEHVQPAARSGRSPAPYTGRYAGAPAGPDGRAADPSRTPDGQLLAGWWQRLAAYLVDSVLVFAVAAVLGWSLVRRIGAAYADAFDSARRAAESGTALPGSGIATADVAGPLLGFAALSLAVSLVYHAGFLKALSATPGKLALGLQVRLRDRPGPLSWGTVLVRWLTQNAASFLSLLPVIGSVAAIYPLLDGLWPLWDAKKQALHDKAAATNVVRLRG
ncbi:MAG TPA: RDD family protein [Nocardioidaceae bacterium]|nr:RDD family protein [Nocardioidaceae bacterium]